MRWPRAPCSASCAEPADRRCISASTSARRASRPSSWTTTTVRRPMASAPLALSHPLPLWSEQAPQDWWQAVVDSLDALADQAPATMAAVRGIGLSGQMLGVALLDAADTPIRPALLWNDGRASAECADLHRCLHGLRRHRRLSRHAGFLGAQAAVADAARTRRPDARPAHPADEGLHPPAPDRRGRERPRRRLGDAADGYRPRRLARRHPGGLRHRSQPAAATCRKRRDLGHLAARPGNALASAGRHAGGGRRRRQYVRGRRRGRGAGWCGLHQPGNVGRLLRRQRSLRAGTRRRHAHPSPRRAGPLRPACRRVERRCLAGVDRRLARQARHRRADRRGRSGKPAAGRHACLHALPCRRAHAARQSPADRHFLGPDPHDGAASPRASRSGRRRSRAGRRPRCAGSRRRQDRAHRLDRRRRAQRAVGAPGRGCDRPAALPCRRPALGPRHRRRPPGARGARRTAGRRGRKHFAGRRRRSAAGRTALAKESPVPRRIRS